MAAAIPLALLSTTFCVCVGDSLAANAFSVCNISTGFRGAGQSGRMRWRATPTKVWQTRSRSGGGHPWYVVHGQAVAEAVEYQRSYTTVYGNADSARRLGARERGNRQLPRRRHSVATRRRSRRVCRVRTRFAAPMIDQTELCVPKTIITAAVVATDRTEESTRT